MLLLFPTKPKQGSDKSLHIHITYFVVHYICMYYPNSHLHRAWCSSHAEATQRSPGIGAALPPLLFSRRIVRHPPSPSPPSCFFSLLRRPGRPREQWTPTTSDHPHVSDSVGGFLQQKTGEDPGNKGGRAQGSWMHVDRALHSLEMFPVLRTVS